MILSQNPGAVLPSNLLYIELYRFRCKNPRWFYLKDHRKKWSEVAQLCLTLWDPVDYSLPGSSVHRILQARILEWVVMLFSRGSFQPRDWTQVSDIAGKFFTVWATREAQRQMKWSEVKVAQSCLILCDHMDCSLPGSSVHRILQVRILEWVPISFSRGSSQPRDWTLD